MSAEIVGNQSVYWRIQHDGAPFINAVGPGVNPGNNQVTAGGPLCNGHDPIPPGNIGVSHGHPGQFLVTLRYQSLAEAYAAGVWVGANVQPRPGGFFLTITVPAITTRANQNANPPAEIRVDW